MESLYVCLFSNGHIKVGRSATPHERIRSHADRVSCLGVALRKSYRTDCTDSADAREMVLIARCADAASERNQSEWFQGLDFDTVCAWAHEAAHQDFTETLPTINPEEPDFRQVVRALRTKGYTQVALARICGVDQSSISDLSTGVTRDPSYSLGSKLIRLLGS